MPAAHTPDNRVQEQVVMHGQNLDLDEHIELLYETT